MFHPLSLREARENTLGILSILLVVFGDVFIRDFGLFCL